MRSFRQDGSIGLAIDDEAIWEQVFALLRPPTVQLFERRFFFADHSRNEFRRRQRHLAWAVVGGVACPYLLSLKVSYFPSQKD